MTERTFRYHRSDFSPLPWTLRHMDVRLAFHEDRVEGAAVLMLTARQPMAEVELDARDLVIHSVERLGGEPEAALRGPFEALAAGHEDRLSRPALPLTHEADVARHKLRISLLRPVDAGGTVAIRVRARCVPSDNILEGIYRDTTPPGCPQQYMSQCQQWGFQRILPVLDDCTAKCTFVTTLEGDARYTHLISNGNISRRLHPRGEAVSVPGDPSRRVITFENPIPMAPYLFIACAGTWDELEDEAVYPSGQRVTLQYLVPPGRIAGAVEPMKILKRSLLWQGETQEYTYRHEVYRTLCMEKSNFGGMENVGNTTIITSAALIDDTTDDRRLEYAHGVILHEFEHNQCGSDVTMETPFDMWLNEAFTVDVERQFMHTQFDPAVMRLDEVDAMRSPIHGPLAVEDGGHLGHIVREGFNDPDELVDGVTYVKAAEVIRMLRLILGDETFRRAKNLYFSRHTGGNANTDQFFACFEEASGRDLSAFRREWLHTIGYPKVEAAHRYDATHRRWILRVRQERAGRGGLFHVPLQIALLDAAGAVMPGSERTLEITGPEQEFTIEADREPAVASLNRGCSFYGTFAEAETDPRRLVRQIRLDTDAFSRVEAMRRLTDLERVKLIRDPGATLSPLWLDTFASLVSDPALPPGLRAYLLRIDEQSLNRDFMPCYRERWIARSRLMTAAAGNCFDALMTLFDATDTYRRTEDIRDGVEARRLRAVLLRLLVETDRPEVHALAEAHLRRAWNITDRVSALQAVNLSSHPERGRILDDTRAAWAGRLNTYTAYLSTVSSGIREDAFERMAAEERSPDFLLSHPSHSRALYLPMAANNRLLWSERGLRWLSDTVIRIAPVNENTAIRMVAALQLVGRLPADLKPLAVASLERMRAGVDGAAAPSVAGRIRAYLEGLEHG